MIQKLTLITCLTLLLEVSFVLNLEAQNSNPTPIFQEIPINLEENSSTSTSNEENTKLLEPCEEATDLTTMPNEFEDSTIGAGNDFTMDCLTNAPDRVYFIDVPPQKIMRYGITDQTYNSLQRVAIGSECPGSLTSFLCQDPIIFSSYIVRNTTSESLTAWWIQDGYSLEEGNFTFSWSLDEPVVNDICAQALPIACGEIIQSSSTLSFPENVPFCGTDLTDDSGVWYKFIGDGNLITASLCGSEYDSKIGIFRGVCNNLECLIGEDNDTIICGENPVVSFQATLGEEYYILVTGANGEWGNFQLQIACDDVELEGGNNCDDPINLADFDGTYTGGLNGYTNNFTEDCLEDNPDRVFYLEVEAGESIEIGQYISFDTSPAHRLAYGSDCSNTTLIECVNNGDYNLHYWHNDTGIKQKVWWFQEGNPFPVDESFSLFWNIGVPAQNDFCSDAIDFSCGSSVSGNTIGATLDSPPPCTFPVLEGSVWYKTQGNGESMTANLCGSGSNTPLILTVYTGTCDELVCASGEYSLECEDNADLYAYTFPTISGQTYYIVVSAYTILGNSGEYQLSLSCDNTPYVDLEITEITAPQTTCNLTNSEDITCTIRNTSTTPQSNFQVSYQIDGGAPITETVTTTLNSAETLDYTFSQKADFSTLGEYQLEVFVNTANDQNPSNDSQTIEIEHIEGLEGVSLIASKESICLGESYIWLRAEGGDFYEWSHSQDDDGFLFINPTQTTTYTVTISDQNGCTTTESITITVHQPPSIPVVSPQSGTLCPGGSIVLSASGENIRWNTGEQGNTIEVTQKGSYRAIASSAEGCETYSAWVYISEVDAPYINATNNGIICEGESATLSVANAFNATFEWSTGATTRDITVTPTQTETTYSVIVTKEGCQFPLDYLILLVPDDTPSSVTNLLPPNGQTGVGLPVNFSWSPAENAALYDLYIGLSENSLNTPVQQNITQINYSYSNLTFGNTYYWKVVPKSCSGIEGPHSDIQSFTLEHLPDLQVTNISRRDTAFAGTEIEISWDVENFGIGNISTTQRRDVVYLSEDNELDFSDKILYSALLDGNATGGTAKINLAPCETGFYYILVRTDRYNHIAESDETNNVTSTAEPMFIAPSPLPDLRIVETPIIGGGNGIFQAGDTEFAPELEWKLTNQGTLATDKDFRLNFFISSSEFYTPLDEYYIGGYDYKQNIAIKDTVAGSQIITIPEFLADGTYYIHILADANNTIQECDNEGNNIATTDSFQVIEIPKPDFFIEQTEISSSTVSNHQQVTLQWQVHNDQVTYEGPLNHRIYLNDTPDLLSPIASQFYSTNVKLPTDSFNTLQTTFTIPDHITGDYYLFVKTNTANLLEGDTENNTSDSIKIEVKTPDLRPSNISASPTQVSAGKNLLIQYQIHNDNTIGGGDLLNRFFQDRLYLSTDGDTDPSNDHYLGKIEGNYTLFAGQSLQRSKSVTIPNGFEGNYRILIHSNATKSVYENDQYENNIALSTEEIRVQAGVYPDLVVRSLSSNKNTATAGDFLQLEFTVENQGDTTAIGNWSDRLHLCTCANWNASQAISLTTRQHSQAVTANGGQYTKTLNVQLPHTLDSDDYYFYLQTDISNSLYETNNDNNRTRSNNEIEINAYQNVDLAISKVTPPNGIEIGEVANVYYEVRNIGETATYSETWFDGLVLSTNDSWEPELDTLIIARWQHNGNLNKGHEYANSQSFTLPTDIGGEYYLLLVIDLENSNSESITFNNTAILPSNGVDGSNTPVTLPEQPDLAMEILSLPANPTAGQPISLQYKVTNRSTEATATGNWSNKFVLSSDQEFNSNDISLTQIPTVTTPLAPNESYTDEIELDIPIQANGNYFLLAKTDPSNHFKEVNENNNADSRYLFVTQAPPSDLQVRNIQAPLLQKVAADMTVSWKAYNSGSNAAEGFFKQDVWLSEDAIWDTDDIFLGSDSYTLALNPQQEAEFSLTARLENVKHQAYYVIVRTDAQNNIPETREDNNTTVSTGQTEVVVPQILIDTPITEVAPTATILNLELPIYYRMEVSEPYAGETIRISLNSNNADAFNELYVSYNAVPKRSDHDWAFGAPFSENQDILLPQVQEGTYYIMAYAVDGWAIQDITLEAAVVPFEILKADANRGGNTGQVTVELTGGKFDAGMDIWLEKGSVKIDSKQLIYLNSTRTYVSFDLTGITPGFFDIKGTSSFGDEATLEEGFEVVEGTISNGALEGMCLIADNEIELDVGNGLTPIELEKIHPAQARPGQVLKVTFRYYNTGNIDIPMPQRLLASEGGFPISETEDDFSENLQELGLEFSFDIANQSLPVIPPGKSVSRSSYVKALGGNGDVIRLVLIDL